MASRPALREPRILDVLSRLASAIDEAAELPGIYDAALNALREGLGVERSSILLFDDGGVMRFVASRGLSDAYRHAVEATRPGRPASATRCPSRWPTCATIPRSRRFARFSRASASDHSCSCRS